MRTVEEQFEDVPHDMECYIDTEGNVNGFAFGLNWSGAIEDECTAKYRKLSRSIESEGRGEVWQTGGG